MTPSHKTNIKRKSLIKSTKAQRVRAEAIALKQERLSLAVNNINQSAFPPKSPHKNQFTLPPKSLNLHKHISHDRFSISNRSVSAPRLYSHNKDINNNKQKANKHNQPSVHTNTQSKTTHSTQQQQSQQTHQTHQTHQTKANVPNFDKLHEQAFKKQKSITSVVKEVCFFNLLPYLLPSFLFHSFYIIF